MCGAAAGGEVGRGRGRPGTHGLVGWEDVLGEEVRGHGKGAVAGEGRR